MFIKVTVKIDKGGFQKRIIGVNDISEVVEITEAMKNENNSAFDSIIFFKGGDKLHVLESIEQVWEQLRGVK